MQHGIGLQSSIWNNNLKSMFLLLSFPFVILGMCWAVFFAMTGTAQEANKMATDSFVFVVIGVVIWFVIAWFSHQSLINKETHARPLERKENPKVYNLLENLCISRGITMPKLFIIDSEALNAYASGISEKTYAVTLTGGIIEKLEDDELEAVIAHELAHIINRDVRLLIVSIIFVGIISVISEMLVRGVFRGFTGRKRGDGKGQIFMILIVIAVAAIGYLLSILIRFALSRRREFLADAGAVELTKNSDALVRALQKISGNSNIEGVDDDVKQMMIDNQVSFLGMFATHPPINDRIAVLKNY
ncbi:MAG: M48 family metallopeptidase [Rickettsiales bacterium]|nr:M48 family metallopeptidase [Pseudomonadota bacterium]MDA0966495.1 M48 family metallopeptidase [Pseudomonadota bacterium]MDG4543357.1 M48 family metallopeptidase [Rickettsiales bacterium]MDG4545623.1 M48 family metallopeptidase [Rickettsiales bacterium]MDG4548072.1 M48 family metallopeptidase [Rickettsiales bacterium]